MPLRQTIGLSLAFLVMSAGANAKVPERAPSHHHGQPQAAKPDRVSARHRTTVREGARGLAHLRVAAHQPRSARLRRSPAAGRAEIAALDTYVDRESGEAEIGKAVWYRRLGCRTASGETLDAVTATAAHRTLPLNSLARVTNLDNGRSVIVRINDRGPASHNLLIDLSPRAAAELDMIRSGTAAVRVEPVEAIEHGAATAVAAYRPPSTQ